MKLSEWNPCTDSSTSRTSIVPGNSQINCRRSDVCKTLLFLKRTKRSQLNRAASVLGFCILLSLCEGNTGTFKPAFYIDATLTISKRQMLTGCYCTLVHPHLKLCTKQLCVICETLFSQLFSGIKPIPQQKFTYGRKLCYIKINTKKEVRYCRCDTY